MLVPWNHAPLWPLLLTTTCQGTSSLPWVVDEDCFPLLDHYQHLKEVKQVEVNNQCSAAKQNMIKQKKKSKESLDLPSRVSFSLYCSTFLPSSLSNSFRIRSSSSTLSSVRCCCFSISVITSKVVYMQDKPTSEFTNPEQLKQTHSLIDTVQI